MSVINKTCELLVSDLLVAIAAGSLEECERRVRIFQALHLPNDDDSGETMSNRRRLVLYIETSEIVVCDEYYPDDNGRVHIVPAHKYGTYNAVTDTLDLGKVSTDVIQVLYNQPEWPVELNHQSADTIAEYFRENIT